MSIGDIPDFQGAEEPLELPADAPATAELSDRAVTLGSHPHPACVEGSCQMPLIDGAGQIDTCGREEVRCRIAGTPTVIPDEAEDLSLSRRLMAALTLLVFDLEAKPEDYPPFQALREAITVIGRVERLPESPTVGRMPPPPETQVEFKYPAAGDLIAVDRGFLVQVDSTCTRVALYSAGIPDALASELRTLYLAARAAHGRSPADEVVKHTDFSHFASESGSCGLCSGPRRPLSDRPQA